MMAISTYAYAFQWFWAETILYFALVPTWYYTIRSSAPALLNYALLTLSTLFYFRAAITAILAERKISALGHRAPRVRDYYPFGLGTLAKALYYFSNWRNHEFWWKMFHQFGNPKNPYTVEAVTIGARLVFTADEENIKAILATQFQDYGKGPQFRKEWKEFLGLSMWLFSLCLLFWEVARWLMVNRRYLYDRRGDVAQLSTTYPAAIHQGSCL